MKLLHNNYLDQMNEEMEILNFKLDRMYEAAFISKDTSDIDNFSLLENVSIDNDDLTIMNEDAYQMYMESLDATLKSIWNAIKRFIKSIFTSTSGETITSNDAKKIVDIISSAAADGDLQSSALKKVAQKGFYLIAGLGTSVDGDKLRAAYESGEVLKFVVQNIKKINVDKIPEGARFRICIAHYDSSVKNSMTMIKYVLETLRDKGIAGIEAMGKNGKDSSKTAKGKVKKSDTKTESVNDIFDDLDVMTEGPKEMLDYGLDKLHDAKAAVTGNHTMSQKEMERRKRTDAYVAFDGPQTDIAVAKKLAVASALALGVAAIVGKVRTKRGNSPTNDHLAMATITYVNEDKPDAMAKVRLYGPSGVTNIDIKGREKVFALRDDLTELADKMSAEGDKLTPGISEQVREFATNINLFFSGLASRR